MRHVHTAKSIQTGGGNMSTDSPKQDANRPKGEIERGSKKAEKSRKPKGRKNILWMIVIPIVLLIICMFAPLIFILSMKVGFHASIESVDHLAEGPGTVLTGAEFEEYKRTIATEYRASFVPSRLEEKAMTFNTIAVLYGPMMLTGAPVELIGIPGTENDDLSSTAIIGFKSFWPMIIFVVAFLILLLVLDLVLANPGILLRFILAVSVVWLLYSILMWAIGEWTVGPVSTMLNRLLTEQQGGAKYVLGFVNVIAAPVRIFLWGIIYWVVSFLIRRSKSERTKDEFAPAGQMER